MGNRPSMKSPSYEDLFEGLTESQAELMSVAIVELESRLKPSRFAHCISVCRTAREMASIYGVDLGYATLAGLLHDWDKCYCGEELFEYAASLGIELTEEDKLAEATLHAVTARKSLALRFPELPQEVLDAVGKHTSGAVEMSELDLLIFIADMLEPTREYKGLKSLRKGIGVQPLPDLFSDCYRKTIKHLVKGSRFIHPYSIDVWNAWVAKGDSE